jgi:hypothetical protein
MMYSKAYLELCLGTLSRRYLCKKHCYCTIEIWIAIDARDIGTAQAIGVLMRYVAVLECNSALISIFTRKK